MKVTKVFLKVGSLTSFWKHITESQIWGVSVLNTENETWHLEELFDLSKKF
jgi:hypothetical protein